METVLPDRIQHAQAAVLGDKVYIGGGITTNPENETKIFVFNHKTEAETKTLKTPASTRWSALATFCGKLVLIGGHLPSGQATNQLWFLQDGVDDDDDSDWIQPIEPMSTPCWGYLPTSSIPTLSIPTSSIPIWSTSHFVNSHLVNSHLVNVDKVGIDKVGIDEVGS